MFLVDDKRQLGLYRTRDVLGKPVPSAFAVNPSGRKMTTLGHIKQSKLLQNYPNPLNPGTWIPFTLVVPTHVTIRIHDSSGQLIRVLDLGSIPAGVYLSKEEAAYWNGRNQHGESVGSGVYFYQLVIDDGYSSTKKMLVAR